MSQVQAGTPESMAMIAEVLVKDDITSVLWGKKAETQSLGLVSSKGERKQRKRQKVLKKKKEQNSTGRYHKTTFKKLFQI